MKKTRIVITSMNPSPVDDSPRTRMHRAVKAFRFALFGLSTIFFLNGHTSLNAQAVNATTADIGDVQAATDSSVQGDTVRVPAGSANWEVGNL